MRIIKLPRPYNQAENKNGRNVYPSPDRMWHSLKADGEYAKRVALYKFGQDLPLGREIGFSRYKAAPGDPYDYPDGEFVDRTGPLPPDKQLERMNAVAQTLHSLQGEDAKTEYQNKVSGELRAELQLRDAPEEWIEYQIYAFWHLVLQMVIFIEDGWRWENDPTDDDIPF